MNVRTKRQIVSIVLLAVLLPMILLSSLHIHTLQPSDAGEECADCVQHNCGGHIERQVQTIDDCVLCQFLLLPMVVAAVVEIVQIGFVYRHSYAQCQPTLLTQTLGIIATRGPPAV